jgi:hypothetical protein
MCMPKKTKSPSKRRQKKATAKQVVRKVIRRSAPVALARSAETRRRRVVAVETPAPTVDTIVTETDVVTEPKVEVRRPATLSQALTEPAEIVVKPETKVVRRVVGKKRTRRAA